MVEGLRRDHDDICRSKKNTMTDTCWTISEPSSNPTQTFGFVSVSRVAWSWRSEWAASHLNGTWRMFTLSYGENESSSLRLWRGSNVNCYDYDSGTCMEIIHKLPFLPPAFPQSPRSPGYSVRGSAAGRELSGYFGSFCWRCCGRLWMSQRWRQPGSVTPTRTGQLG